jgi:ABC-type glycerol-3-phosphate transport system substrate-binding protein
VPGSLSAGNLLALPYVGNSQLFFYRKDLFQKHNLKPPTRWDDVLTAAQTISEQETNGAPGGGRISPNTRAIFITGTRANGIEYDERFV